MTTYIKSISAATLNASLLAAGVLVAPVSLNKEEKLVFTAPGLYVDIIGVMYEPTDETTEANGIISPVMVAMPGYHANIYGVLTQEQLDALPTIPAPTTPYRVMAE